MSDAAPITMRIPCPACGELHIDEGEFATKPHHTHSCQHCGLTWRPAVVPTVGVRFLPGFKNAPTAAPADAEPIPPGYKLAPGWSTVVPPAAMGGPLACITERCYADAVFYGRNGACAAHAVEKGALIKVEPPAEPYPCACPKNGRHGKCPNTAASSGGLFCAVCRPSSCKYGHGVDCEPAEQPASASDEAEVDWKRFVPTDEIPRDDSMLTHGAMVPGDIFASWAETNRDHGTVRVFVRPHIARHLAGNPHYWTATRCRIIRHADGRWADGYGPNGPIETPAPAQGAPAEPLSVRMQAARDSAVFERANAEMRRLLNYFIGEVMTLEARLSSERERCAGIAEWWLMGKGKQGELSDAIRDGRPAPK